MVSKQNKNALKSKQTSDAPESKPTYSQAVLTSATTVSFPPLTPLVKHSHPPEKTQMRAKDADKRVMRPPAQTAQANTAKSQAGPRPPRDSALKEHLVVQNHVSSNNKTDHTSEDPSMYHATTAKFFQTETFR